MIDNRANRYEPPGRDGGAAFLHELEVNVLPLVQFYANGERVEAFPCGPRKIELLREKLEKWQNWHRRVEGGVEHLLPETIQNESSTADKVLSLSEESFLTLFK